MSETRPANSVRQWLLFGWRSFLQTRWISIAFSSVFCVVGGLLYWLLLRVDAGLIIFPFVAGFFIVAPVLIIGFQQAAAILQNNLTPTFADLIVMKGTGNNGIWFLIFILCMCYFIWITDALIIYSLYFGIEPLPLDAVLFTDPGVRDSVLLYLFYSGLMGLITAIIGFFIGVFSIPLIIHQGTNFVTAVSVSIKTVLNNKWLMTKWAMTLVAIMTLTLVLALPLLVVVFPVLGYASYAVYRDLLPDSLGG